MDRLDELTARIVEAQTIRDWKQFHKPKNLAIALVAEAAELAAEYRFADEPISPDNIRDEIGDVLYNALLFCHEAGIDPAEAAQATLDKNDRKYPVNKYKGKPHKYDELA